MSDHAKEVDQIFEAVSGYIGRSLKPLVDRIAALEARPTPDYKGVWKANTTYPQGTLITSSGSMWFAIDETRARPGTGPGSGWVMAVKSGSLPRRDE